MKTLVVYFSRAGENYGVEDRSVGNTEILAKEIIRAKNANEFKINPATPYPADYQTCVEIATKEHEANARPEYVEEIDISDYDEIYLGYPIWWGDAPMIVYSFLEKHDFTGKTIYPFCTHEGSGESGTYANIEEVVPGATVADGFELAGHVARTERGIQKLQDWLKI